MSEGNDSLVFLIEQEAEEYSNSFEQKGVANVSGLCVVALNKNLKLTTTLDRAITQNPCYVPFLFGL